MDNIISIPIPMSDILDKIIWKFTSDGNYSVKTAIQAK